jgi:hypothetical protein
MASAKIAKKMKKKKIETSSCLSYLENVDFEGAKG